MKLVIFEDQSFDNFYPLTYLRPVFELRCGATLLMEKMRRLHPGAEAVYFMRAALRDTFLQRYPGARVNDLDAIRSDDCLFANGRLLLAATALPGGPSAVCMAGDQVAFARADKATLNSGAAAQAATLEDLLAVLKGLPQADLPADAHMIGYPWDLVHHNADAIRADFAAAGKRGVEGQKALQAVIYGDPERVYIAPGAEIHPLAVIDVKGGPVTIDAGAEVHPFTRIEGPTYIGKKTILFGAKVREGTSIGPMCRIGGEVEESIVHGCSNKYHDGFLGHAYVCEWVNLGALTTNSDLKNDYTNVEVYVKGQLTDTGMNKVGSFIGDHTKTSIGVLFNTGTVVGMMTNVVNTGGICPKLIPSFCLHYGKPMKGFGFKSMVDTARISMSRRKAVMTEADLELLKYAFEIAKPERDAMIKKARKG
ncbi:MAG TPA: putative sugar nucleotidyl transferase [Candidatus Brocadiia bacterium]|nr:putative sugar nucleotidyl transferase [Candidatus Brocadiia bacterium]